MDEATVAPFWSQPADRVLRALGSTEAGLAETAARQRRADQAFNRLRPDGDRNTWRLLLAQFKSPIIVLLLLAAGLSYVLDERADALIIAAIVVGSGLLSFWQERGAANAVAHLLGLIQTTVTARRDGQPRPVPLEAVVPGDIVLLTAGDAIPGDGLLLAEKDLFVDEAALTGESYPAEKEVGLLPAETPLGRRTNAVFLGTHVVSGTATALIVLTGRATEFGQIAGHLTHAAPETEFERGIRRFGYLLLEVTLLLVIAIFAINVYFARPVVTSFLFALALAVGLTPQLLPAIISITLAQGAKRMATRRVIVRQLVAIENFGSMTVLCSDKTGTLTEGVVRLYAAQGLDGRPSERVRRYAYLNAAFESGFANPIDQALRAEADVDITGYQRLDEVPYDFIRKRLSILASHAGRTVIVTKGALAQVLDACATVALPDGTSVPLATARAAIDERFRTLSADGFRVLGVASREVTPATRITRADEREMTFVGFLAFHDPPKSGINATLDRLRALGIGLKVITGDNRLVAAAIGRQVGLSTPTIMTGTALHHLSDEALRRQAGGVDIFAEVEPNQKERIILALRAAGQVVGYLGDGINDAAALHAADVGISVNGAVAVARDAATIVLLEKDLDVLVQGVRDGRATFANTLKYVFVTTSANFGNMVSMAAISLVLPFLPLLPKQILLTNFLSDIPAMTIAADSVDPELVATPRRWNVEVIRAFMITFGLVSSVFDLLTFGALLFLLGATTAQFRTGWFLESVMTELLIMLIIRTRRPFFRSRPGRSLLIATVVIALVTVGLPYSPLAEPLELVPLPPTFLALLGAITVLYVALSELTKRFFFGRVRL